MMLEEYAEVAQRFMQLAVPVLYTAQEIPTEITQIMSVDDDTRLYHLSLFRDNYLQQRELDETYDFHGTHLRIGYTDNFRHRFPMMDNPLDINNLSDTGDESYFILSFIGVQGDIYRAMLHCHYPADDGIGTNNVTIDMKSNNVSHVTSSYSTSPMEFNPKTREVTDNDLIKLHEFVDNIIPFIMEYTKDTTVPEKPSLPFLSH